MNFLSIIKLKADIIIRKQLLNVLLILFSPTNTLTVFISQNLDKYIVRHQKKLFLIYSNKHIEPKQLHELVA